MEETLTDCYTWALLDNHVHLLLLPTGIPISVLMRCLLTGYAVSFNLIHNRTGHLFQNRYKSVVCHGDALTLKGANRSYLTIGIIFIIITLVTGPKALIPGSRVAIL